MIVITLTVANYLQFTKSLHRIAEDLQKSEEFRGLCDFHVRNMVSEVLLSIKHKISISLTLLSFWLQRILECLPGKNYKIIISSHKSFGYHICMVAVILCSAKIGEYTKTPDSTLKILQFSRPAAEAIFLKVFSH